MAKKPVTKLVDINLEELSLVTRGANQHANISITKADETSEVEAITKFLSVEDGARSFTDFLANEKKRKKLCDIREETWPLFDSLRESVNSILLDESVSADEKTSRIRESVSQFVTSFESADIEKAVTIFNKLESGEMTKEMEKANTEDLEKKVAELTKRAEEAETLAKMSDEEKKYMGSLDKEAAAKFMAADEKARAGMMKKSADADEVFKSVHGTEIRKSDVGAAIFEIMKAQDEELKKSRDEIAKERDARVTAELTKSAEDDYGNLPGETVAKVSVLKAMSAMGEEERKALSEMLKAGNDALSGAFTVQGTGAGDKESIAKAAKLESLTKAYVEKNPGTSHAVAMTAVLSANPELYEG